mgnify:CR=1 FL=1
MPTLTAFFQSAKLPIMTEVAHALIRTLNDESASNAQVEAIIAKDPALTANLLRTANSAQFGLSRQVHAWWPLAASAFLLGGRVAPLFIAEPARRDAATWHAFVEWGIGFALFMTSAAIAQHAGLPPGALATLDPDAYPIVGWRNSLTMTQEIQWGALHFAALSAVALLVRGEARGKIAIAVQPESASGGRE